MADIHAVEPTRRDFLYVATGSLAAVGAAFTVWPLIDQMNPDASVLALASIEVDISNIPVGQETTFKWRGKPVFVRHRTEAEIAAAESVDVATLPDPQTDAERLVAGPNGEVDKQWLVVIGICTHLGCVPLAYRGEYDGYFCPCHGSVYDTSGRIRKGPAPTNLEVPPYAFISDTRIKIG
ncbi:ubiquinol-cytochrome c reductase, iron-sulfur subunit [Parvibaculum lavamentivorans DS-1]|uniref:Ubiquinol-cytochrome c reductase iron-sulfur subunit n=1 Tax=Parvibaculum lavamentivorans (strain DS-1 / DSM 13023 / NCIMB 13966) TaxID=402881 RepID=A7HVC3_PARL1|nr:ubiquinol-cytochrome c reductase iron-sulfur subunit [Parvibaculum lavamentivorans]ABS63856.1 ubiquinol-cytochrome c reductase, iron-sulfur subunit [Parvibaculum lavamentivorans DS-1]